ncbi:MAG: hypothetical protein FWG98_03305 [Candidatus Cloacimonetes bacterium]|nr:hypothetical protein [Candidatus Cloacimonadota bacterium]
MTYFQKIFILLLLVGSVCGFIFAIVSFFKQNRKHKGKNINEKLFIPILCLLASIFCLRYIIGIYTIFLTSLDAMTTVNYSWFEKMFNSLVRTLQTFSLDEEYAETILLGKELFLEEFNSRFLSGFYGLFSAILNLCAPFAGGAVILGILTRLFPGLVLFFTPYQEKYVFSELNERAIWLAEDIIREARKVNTRHLPLIVFTDAYIDNESETVSELFQRAKEIGAVCVRDDLLKIPFTKTKKLHYILIDEEDICNINALTSFVTMDKDNWKKGCNIYVFSQNPEASSIVKKLYEDEWLNKSNIVIKIIQEFTSIVYNLFNEIPLFTPLLSKYPPNYIEEKELEITIIGGGLIGQEAFLNAYWCGQLLNCRLKINVITENSKIFEAKINLTNPEIMQTVIDNHELLRIFPGLEKYSQPYAKFYFEDVDVKTDKLMNVLNENSLLSSDYFIVALGTDELNIVTASNIDRMVRKKLLNDIGVYKPIIAYSVFDSKTNEVLNNIGLLSNKSFRRAFASLKNIYSCRNIFMNDINKFAYDISNTHSEKDMTKFLKDEYGWWSSIARDLHFKYKMYSIGLYREDDDFKILSDEKIEKYLEIVKNNTPVSNSLTWLEHRRWNAFMRSKGFIAPTKSQWNYYAYNKEEHRDGHKHLGLKLHPFIVESSEDFLISEKDWDDPNYANNSKLDFLDIASIMKYITEKERSENPDKVEKVDYKVYDKPEWGIPIL